MTGNQQYRVYNNHTLVHEINLSAHNKILFENLLIVFVPLRFQKQIDLILKK